MRADKSAAKPTSSGAGVDLQELDEEGNSPVDPIVSNFTGRAPESTSFSP